ncbi:unnamed protein product [Adineta ricciae]|nr:unnamed protein product [Adineta ricciae]
MHLEINELPCQTQLDTQDLTCPICMSIAGDPRVTSCCHRVFCAKDADPNQYQNGCPLCREKDFHFERSPKHKELLEQLTIKCVCSEYIAHGDYENHLNRCLNTRFTCPHTACREKNSLTEYNSQELVSHLGRYHCDEVPVLGTTYIKKSSVESYRKASNKYDDLVKTLYSVIYPKMINIQLKNLSSNQQNAAIFKCPQGHTLIEADHTKRKRRNGVVYTSNGFSCDVCRRVFASGSSWHCSCTNGGYDKCIDCVVFDLYNLDDPVLKLASTDRVEQQERARQRSLRESARVSRELSQALTEHVSDDDIDDDDDDQVNYELLGSRLALPLLLARQRATESGNHETNHEEN